MQLASLARDCFPLPPTPTNKAWPQEGIMIRVILHTCFIASSNNTRFIMALFSLYSFNASLMCNFRFSLWTQSYCLSPERPWVKLLNIKFSGLSFQKYLEKLYLVKVFLTMSHINCLQVAMLSQVTSLSQQLLSLSWIHNFTNFSGSWKKVGWASRRPSNTLDK